MRCSGTESWFWVAGLGLGANAGRALEGGAGWVVVGEMYAPGVGGREPYGLGNELPFGGVEGAQAACWGGVGGQWGVGGVCRRVGGGREGVRGSEAAELASVICVGAGVGTAEDVGFLRAVFGWGAEAIRSFSPIDCLPTMRETLRGGSVGELQRARFLEVLMVAGEEVCEVCPSSPMVCGIDGGRFPATVGRGEEAEEEEGGIVVDDGGRFPPMVRCSPELIVVDIGGGYAV